MVVVQPDIATDTSITIQYKDPNIFMAHLIFLFAAIPVIRNAAIHQHICSERSERKICLCGIALLCLAYVKANTYELLTLIFEIPPGV